MFADRTGWRDARAFVAALVLYGLFYAGFFLQSFLSGQLIALSDSLDFGVAAYLSRPALWTEGMYSGYPVAADPQALTWYPLLYLFRLLRLDWNLFLISAYVLTASTAFILIRRLSGSTLAGAFGGFVASFNAMTLAYLANFNQVHAFAWVPLVFYGLQLVREGAHRRGFFVTALATGLMWLAGHPQIAVYTMYLAGAMAVVGATIDPQGRAAARTRLLWSGLALVAGLSLAAVAILPMIELGAWSGRAEANWDLYTSSPYAWRELLKLLTPFAFGGFWSADGVVAYLGESGDSAYVGLVPFALALAAPVLASRFRTEARLWLGAAAVEVLLALGPATPLGTLFYYVPGYARFQAPVRHLFLVSLCLTVSASLALAAMLRTRTFAALTRSALATVILTAVGLAGLVWWDPPIRESIASNAAHFNWAVVWPLALGTLLVSIGLVGQRVRASVFAGVVLVAVHVVDLSAFHYRIPGYRFTYGDVRREEAVARPRVTALREELVRSGERVLAIDGSKNPFLLPNLTRAWGVPAATGSGSLSLAHYVDLFRLDAAGSVPDEVLVPEHAAIDLFAVRYTLAREGTPFQTEVADDASRWETVERWQYYEDDPDTRYVLLKNRRPLARARCTPEALEIDRDETLTALRTGQLSGERGFDPRRTTLVEPGSLPGWASAVGSPGEAIVARTRAREYRVQTLTPCVLAVGEVFYPWWRARIDEDAARVLRVNHAMVGVVVPPGLHVVRFSLLPVSVYAGGTLSALGLLAIVGGARRRVRRT